MKGTGVNELKILMEK